MTTRLAPHVVADVAAAILRGRVLHADEEGDGEWGVLDTSRALDAFDPCGEGWTRSAGGDAPPARYPTREAAEQHARRLSGSSYDGRAYEATRIPSRPVRATVGPYHEAVRGLAFRCVDWTNGAGEVVTPVQIVPSLVPAPWGFEKVDDYEDDPSAFGAALAFVRLVGERAAYAALARAT